MNIGEQIKRLREERRLTGKDLAHQIGLSQSQMSRLEKGQRRIDTEILARIASALDVSPAVFFNPDDSAPASDPLSLRRERELEVSHLHKELGKLIRAERRKRHLTSDDLARKTGHTKAYVLAVEQGRRNGLTGDFLSRACRILAIDPFAVVDIQDRIIRDLKTRVHQLDREQAGRTIGEELGQHVSGTPILVGDEAVYPSEFDESGHPMAAVEGFVLLPDLGTRPTFALRVCGDEMDGEGSTSFREGDLVIFATDRSARSGELAFVRYRDDQTSFRRLYHDDEQVIRLQALRAESSPVLLALDEVISAWPLVAHLRSTETSA